MKTRVNLPSITNKKKINTRKKRMNRAINKVNLCQSLTLAFS